MEMADKFGIAIVFVICFVWQANAAVNCTSNGRFPEPTDTTCKNYTFCVASGTTYIGYDYVCPTTSLFNPNSGQCTTNYTCTATGQPPTNNTTSLGCTTEGFIPDPSSTNCSSYLQCISENGIFVASTLTCPPGTFYNPTNTFCEATYNCTTPFSCVSTGRFPDPEDTTCKLYNLCVLETNGTLINYQYTCPSTSVFNPNSSICTTSYTCPT